ncbi:lateral flagellar hook length control protein (FliK-like) [Escherichia coli]|uniref:Lateral flagellar hook length control protein (FliK-like) n=1 Tax=Escherichia coli TaxID=562 RepID=A0A376KZV8_ECOLX|nr:lateral flagellar hook length control protein (FliK-like) [Escherichia coli]
MAMQALMALLLPQPAAPHQDTPQPRNVATSPVIQQLTKAVGAKRAATPDATAGTHAVAAAVAGTDQSVAAGEARTAGQTGDLR